MRIQAHDSPLYLAHKATLEDKNKDVWTLPVVQTMGYVINTDSKMPVLPFIGFAVSLMSQQFEEFSFLICKGSNNPVLLCCYDVMR